MIMCALEPATKAAAQKLRVVLLNIVIVCIRVKFANDRTA